MTTLIRQKHSFKYHWKEFYCWDLTLEDFLLLNIDIKEGLNKVLAEFNEDFPVLNNRQTQLFISILFWQDNLLNKLDKKKQNNEDFLNSFHIIEGQVMHFLNQPLSEIRKRPYRYFIKQYEDIVYSIWQKKYEWKDVEQKPNKKEFKKELWDFYT